MNLIPYRDIEHHVPSNTGQVKINHDNCPAGVDTKQRLYIRRKEDGSVVWYCHHCNGRGAQNTTPRRRTRDTGYTSGVEGQRSVAEGANWRSEPYIRKSYTEGYKHCSIKARAFLSPIDPADVDAYGIAQLHKDKSEVYNERVCIPCYSATGLCAVQYRRISDTDDRKYITLGTGYFDSYYLRRGHRSYETSTLVITEDVLSAIKVGGRYRSIALLNSLRIKELENILKVAKGYDRVVVWLDNDNYYVKRNARRLAREIGLHVKDVLLVTGYTDPKHYTMEKIAEVVDGRKADKEEGQ